MRTTAEQLVIRILMVVARIIGRRMDDESRELLKTLATHLSVHPPERSANDGDG